MGQLTPIAAGQASFIPCSYVPPPLCAACCMFSLFEDTSNKADSRLLGQVKYAAILVEREALLLILLPLMVGWPIISPLSVGGLGGHIFCRLRQ